MTYFPHLAPKELSLEKHERGMFSQQGCSFKPLLNMVFNHFLILSPFLSLAIHPNSQKTDVKVQGFSNFKSNQVGGLNGVKVCVLTDLVHF